MTLERLFLGVRCVTGLGTRCVPDKLRLMPLPRPDACGNYLSSMTPLETYLRELREIRTTGAGVEEESYYHPLAALLNEVGKKLKPKVKCVLQLANRGAGKPDGSTFMSLSLRRSTLNCASNSASGTRRPRL